MTGRGARYPLAAVEGLRRRALDAARGAFAEAAREAERSRARATESQAALEEAAARRRAEEERSPEGEFADLGAWSRWLSRLRSDELRARGEREEGRRQADEAEAAVAAFRGAVADAERQLQAVERHREGWERARRLAAEAAEEAELEDRAGDPGGQRAT